MSSNRSPYTLCDEHKPEPGAVGTVGRSGELLLRYLLCTQITLCFEVPRLLPAPPKRAIRPLPPPPMRTVRPLPPPPPRTFKPLPPPPIRTVRPLPPPPIRTIRLLPAPPTRTVRPLPPPPPRTIRPLPALPATPTQASSSWSSSNSTNYPTARRGWRRRPSSC